MKGHARVATEGHPYIYGRGIKLDQT